MEEFPMKILFATAALATLVSSSAHAQYGFWGGVPPSAAYSSYGFNRAYARVSPYAAYGAYGSSQVPTPSIYDLYGYRAPYPYSVYDVRGQYVGSDPDARVRSQ